MLKLRIKFTLTALIFLSYGIAFSQLTLEDILLNNKYAVEQGEDVEFLHTEPLFARLTDSMLKKNISFYNCKNEKVKEIILSEYTIENVLEDHDWSGLQFSASDNIFLLNKNCERAYRRSAACNYFIGTKDKKLTPLTKDKVYFPDISEDEQKIAYVKEHNLFLKNLKNNREVQITQDGKWNYIINGKSDWVYEEELELTKAFIWNKPSNKIAYLKFNEEAVKEYSIPFYYDMQYPNTFTYKYPKVGEKNSTITAWYYDLKSKKNKQIVIPYSYEYIPRIYWNSSGEEMVLMLLNRHQDSLQLIGYNIKNKQFRVLYKEYSNTYIDIPKEIQFLSDNSFLLNSEQSGFNHLYHFDSNGQLIRQLTTGNYEITNTYGVCEKQKLIYYQSNEENELETNIYSLNYETGDKQKLSLSPGTNNAQFSNDFSFYMNTYSSAITPPQLSIVHTVSGNKTLLEDNKTAKEALLGSPKKEFFKVYINDYYLNAWMIKPTDFDSTRQYPLLVYVYGGPGNQAVLNDWSRSNQLYFNYLAQQGYIIACVDNRGTGGRGEVFKKMTFLNLGKYETEDQINAAKYFSTLKYINKDRIGIYGSSYGGYMAALCLLEGNTVFKAAIVVAPVTDWSLYDNIYTERYMHTIEENPKGYQQFNPLSLAEKLTGNLLLIHGTADDNVHFQHSIFFTNALNDANKNYDFIIYPDANHGMGNKKNRYDMYLKMTEFLKRKL